MVMDFSGQEIEFELIGGFKMAGKEWGFRNGTPILALHGWLDNAATWDVTIPLLHKLDPTFKFHIVSLDLAGHGHTDHRHPQADYSVVYYTMDCIQVAEKLHWPVFGLLAHSMGAMTSIVMAGLFPDRVKNVVLIEPIAPFYMEPDAGINRFRRSFLEKMEYFKKKSTLRVFKSVDEAVKTRMSGPYALSAVAAQPLLDRGLKKLENGYCWASDPRLISTSSVSLSKDYTKALFSNIACSIYVIMADVYQCYLTDPELLPILQTETPTVVPITVGVPQLKLKLKDLKSGNQYIPMSNEVSNKKLSDPARQMRKRTFEINTFKGVSAHHLHLEPDTALPVAQVILDFYRLQGDAPSPSKL